MSVTKLVILLDGDIKLPTVPEKSGYIGSWSVISLAIFPAQNLCTNENITAIKIDVRKELLLCLSHNECR